MLSVERGGPYRRLGPPSRPVDRRLPHLDSVAITSVVVLIGLGLLNLEALGGRALTNHQLTVVLGGLVLFLVVHRFRTASLPWLGWSCYGLSIVLLLAVEFFGSSSYGARRWLTFGSFTLQPSELAKLGLLLVLAQVLGTDRAWYQRLCLAVAVAAVPIGLVVLEPDLSTATVLTALTLAMLVVGRIPWRTILVLLGALALAAPLAEHLLHPYQVERLNVFLSGSRSASGPGWAILQAHIALGWGGLTGQSRKPMHLLLAQYLPERETDLAFSSLVEQWGILAGLVAVLAAAVLIWRVVAASRCARTRSAGLSAAGFAALIGIEVLVSVSANLGLLPTAGVPFPLLSYGGTAAAVHIAMLGIVLGMRADAERHRLWLATRRRRVHPRLIRLTALAVTAQLLAMTGFAWQLQRSSGAGLRAAGLDQMTRCVRIPAPRGIITDRHGVPVATNVAQDEVWVVPALLTQHARTQVAALTARPEAVVRRLIASSRTALTVPIATLPPVAAARVAAAHLTGVMVVSAPRRHYPYGELLGPILGWTGVATPVEMQRWPGLPLGEVVGRAGVEQTYDPILRGVNGQQCLYVDPTGVPVAMGPRTPAIPGAPLRLSIDLGLQKALTSGLATAIQATPEHSGGDLGAAVVLDPRNGQMLAMASLPSYDDNVFGPPVDEAGLARVSNTPGNPMLEHVTQAVAPPGSTFKLVVASADLVHHAIPPDLVIETGGSWTLGGHTFHNWSALPPQNLVQAIAWSNDVYFYQLAWALGPDAIISTARQFGVGQPTGIDLPGESAGYLGTPASVKDIGATWYPGSTVLLGIGQGYLAVTPLQNAVWTAGVATGAVVTPHVGLAYGSSATRFSLLSWPSPRRLTFAGQLGPVRTGMRSVVTSGTALILQSLPVPAGGKTGTAEDPSAPGEGLDSWLSAVAPFDPETMQNPVIEATAFIRGQGNGHPSSEVVRSAMAYFFQHQKAILASLPATLR
jgi:cell division protein FtsI/penicillin-binding protein 2/cell division protein FtsW (lipid II flippase)